MLLPKLTASPQAHTAQCGWSRSQHYGEARLVNGRDPLLIRQLNLDLASNCADYSCALPLIESVRYELRIRLSVFEKKEADVRPFRLQANLYIESLRFFDTGE